MKQKSIMLALVASFLLSGCNMASISNSLKSHHYMATGDYQQGVKTFAKSVRETPENASGHYYLGRFLLAQHKYDQALPHLKTAARLDPDEDYYFWQGLAYGQLGDNANEKKSYIQALKLDSDHSQSCLYLGHLKLKENQYKEALQLYDSVLKQYPSNPSALYNRGLTLKVLAKNVDEKNAWLKYLDLYPAGYLANRAADHLNGLGDFSYRNYYLGKRTVTLKEIRYSSRSSNQLSSTSYPSLKLIGAILVNRPEEILQVVVYENGNPSLARKRANSIKTHLLDRFSEIEEHQIQVSWFQGPEKLKIGKKTFKIQSSVRFFGTGKA